MVPLVLAWTLLSQEPRVIVNERGLWLDRADGMESVALVCGLVSCNSILKTHRLDRNSIGADCHINPSTSEYFVIDVAAGKVLASYLGHGFQPSPDGKRVAHAGFMPHFAPPYAHSDYLQIDGKTVYPAGNHREPFYRVSVPADPLLHRNILDFRSGIAWSPDSSKVAVVQRVFDFRRDGERSDTGSEENERFGLIIAGQGIRPRILPLAAVDGRARARWVSADRVEVSSGDFTRTFRVE